MKSIPAEKRRNIVFGRPEFTGNFRWLLLAEFVSSAGTELSLIAISIAVIRSGGSALDVGLMLGARTLPPILVLFFGGVLIDRLPRGRIVVVASSVALVVQVALGVHFLADAPSLAVLLPLQAALGAVTAVVRPAIVGLLPQVVAVGNLQSANSLLAIASNTASILGPVSAGVLLLFLPAAPLILIDALTFGVAAVLVLKLWNIPAPSPEKRSGYWADLRGGWSYLWRTPWLTVTVGQALVLQATFAVFFVLGPVLMSGVNNGASVWALTATSYGVGAIFGSFVALRYQPKIPLVAMQVILIFSAPLLLAAASSIPLLLLVPLTLLAGAAVSLADTLWEAYFQQVTPVNMLGRVSSIANLMAASLRPLGYLLAGQAAVATGISTTFGISGALLLVSILVALIVIVPVRARLVSPTHEAEATNA